MEFCSLSSGSSGNCYYVGNGGQGILVDAGISARSIRRFLKEEGISMSGIMGVLVTHNHSDHIRGLEVLSRRGGLPAYTTAAVWKSILSPGVAIPRESAREIRTGERFSLAGLDIEAFTVSHDAPETIGFHLSCGDDKMTIATDLGHIGDEIVPYLEAANLLVLESNYDEEMLMSGRYPWFLKERIRSAKGHLGNHQASAFLAERMGDHLTHVCLAHLSRNNNTPERALATLREALSASGSDPGGRVTISVLSRSRPSGVIRLNGRAQGHEPAD